MKFALESYSYIYYGCRDKWIDKVLVNNHQKREFLLSRGLASDFVPFGSHPEYGEDLHIPRDIDVLFLGSVRRAPFRKARLGELVRSLQKRGIRVVEATKGYYGVERTRLINRSKLMLQLHKYPWDLPTMRWCLASACGALIVSEPVANPKPFKPEIDYISGSLESMPDLIEDIIADEARRNSMVTSCQERIRTELSYDRSMKYIADLVKSTSKR